MTSLALTTAVYESWPPSSIHSIREQYVTHQHATSHEHRGSAASTVLHESAYGSDKKASVIRVHPRFPTEEYHHTTRQPSTGYKLVSALWSLDLASTAICVGFFATYWWLLEYYDDKPVSKWKGPQARLSPLKNLPAAAAIVMTAFRVFLSYPIAVSMGQLKWHHFGRPWPRPVADLQAFDAASRDTFGSARLLFSKNILYVVLIIVFLRCAVQKRNVIADATSATLYTSPLAVF